MSIKEVQMTDIASEKGVRSGFSAMKKDIAEIKKRLCLIENCQHCKHNSCSQESQSDRLRR